MARRRRNHGTATAAATAAPAVPQTELQRAAAAIRKRSARRANLAELDAGLPPPEQLAKNVYRTVQIKDPDAPSARLVRRNLSSRNLERWQVGGKITAEMYRAGDRYRTDWELTGFEPCMTAKYGIVSTGGGDGTHTPAMPTTLRQMDAWRRWREARTALGSLANGFDAVVLNDQLAEEIHWEHDRIGIWTRRTSMMAVLLSLERLALHYGI